MDDLQFTEEQVQQLTGLGPCFLHTHPDSESNDTRIVTSSISINTSFSNREEVLIINGSGAGITLTQGTDVILRLAGTATTGSRALASWGEAFLRKIGTDEWLVYGPGVT